MVPAKDSIIFAPASKKEVGERLIEHGKSNYETEKEKISKTVFHFSQSRKELGFYEA